MESQWYLATDAVAHVPVRLAPWLIPNPVNPYVPQLERDVSEHPSTARRVTVLTLQAARV
ncbi:hypothetical protein EDD15DRAFT_2247661, partial [Pisolithus albus]